MNNKTLHIAMVKTTAVDFISGIREAKRELQLMLTNYNKEEINNNNLYKNSKITSLNGDLVITLTYCTTFHLNL